MRLCLSFFSLSLCAVLSCFVLFCFLSVYFLFSIVLVLFWFEYRFDTSGFPGIVSLLSQRQQENRKHRRNFFRRFLPTQTHTHTLRSVCTYLYGFMHNKWRSITYLCVIGLSYRSSLSINTRKRQASYFPMSTIHNVKWTNFIIIIIKCYMYYWCRGYCSYVVCRMCVCAHPIHRIRVLVVWQWDLEV